MDVPVLVGHRGAPLAAIENTIPSLLSAAGQGAWGVEFDVRATADGVPILLHDRTFQRFWDHPARPGEMPLDQVRRLHCDADPALTVPTLVEVTEAVTIQLVVDGKEPALMPRIVSDLSISGALDRSWFIGEPPVLTEVRRVLPDAQIILSWAHATPPPGDLFDAVRPFAINLPWPMGCATVTRWARDMDLEVWTYCVDTADDAACAMELQLDALISNDLLAIGDVARSASGEGTIAG
jgi:glycerophosphoryl diester phosphodiesterase